MLSPGDPGHAWIDQVNDSALNVSLATIPWLPRAETHPADWYTSVTDGVGPVWDRPLAQRLTRAYHGQTAETDYMMGLVMDALAANRPAAANAWTLFTSDHGEMHLEHRIVQKMSMYEGSGRARPHRRFASPPIRAIPYPLTSRCLCF
jgi:arylsulfatase A-like enzyme